MNLQELTDAIAETIYENIRIHDLRGYDAIQTTGHDLSYTLQELIPGFARERFMSIVNTGSPE